MSVTYSKNKGCHTVTSTGINESLHRCLKLVKMQPNISCVPATKSSVNLLQRTPKKTLFWESSSESKLVVPDIINVLSIRSQLSHCSTYILGEDTMNHSSMRRKRQSKDDSTLIKGFTAFPCIVCQCTEPVMIPPSLVNICFACDHLKVRMGSQIHILTD